MKRLKRPRESAGKRFSAPDTPTGSSQQRRPLFSLQYLSTDPEYSLSRCTREQKAAFADMLAKLSQMSWAEINQAPRHGLGCEKISPSSIKAAIPSHITEDVNFLAFRFWDKAPMVGYRRQEVFYIIWLDRNFRLYDH